MAAKPTTPSQLQDVVDSYDTFMFDCDGVLWHGDHLIPGTIEVLAYLRQQSKHWFPSLRKGYFYEGRS
jgi:4-nitrophenyl phosphatase